MKQFATRLFLLVSLLTLVVALAGPNGSKTAVPEAKAQFHAPVQCNGTGNKPRLIWSQAWQDTWTKACQDNNKWWQSLMYQADQSNGDTVIVAMAYQITGDEKYAQKVWDNLKGAIIDNGPAVAWRTNDFQNNYWHIMLVYDWIRPWMEAHPDYTPTAYNPATNKRSAYLKFLNESAAKMRDLDVNGNYVTEGNGTTQTDSDRTVAFFFNVAWLQLATWDHNPYALNDGTGKPLLNSVYHRPDNWHQPNEIHYDIGGLDYTGNDQPPTDPNKRWLLRDALSSYAYWAKGGTWVESSEYNLVTPGYLMIGMTGVKTAVCQNSVPNYPCKNYFPEFDSLPNELAITHLMGMPDPIFDKATYPWTSTYFQWGELHYSRAAEAAHRTTTSGMYAGYLKGTQTGKWLQKLTDMMYDFPGDGNQPQTYARLPYAQFYALFDPNAPSEDWHGKLPKVHYAPNLGVLMHSNPNLPTNLANGVLFAASAFGQTGMDHTFTMPAMDFQLIRKGEYPLTHVNGWGLSNLNDGGDTVNGMVIGGLSWWAEARGPIAEESGPNNEYSYLVGSTGGQWANAGSSTPPETFLHEWTRSTFYLPGKDSNAPETIVTYDRVNAQNPWDVFGYAKPKAANVFRNAQGDLITQVSFVDDKGQDIHYFNTSTNTKCFDLTKDTCNYPTPIVTCPPTGNKLFIKDSSYSTGIAFNNQDVADSIGSKYGAATTCPMAYQMVYHGFGVGAFADSNFAVRYAVKQWVIHQHTFKDVLKTDTIPMANISDPTAITWKTDLGQNVKISTLLPADQDRLNVNEALYYKDTGIGTVSYDRKWQTRITPKSNQQWDTFLNVEQVYDNGTTLTNKLVKSDDQGSSEGVLISRPGVNDALLMFSATKGTDLPQTPLNGNYQRPYNPNQLAIIGAKRLRKSGYTVSNVTTTTATTDVYLMDLDKTKKWSISIDGSTSPLTLTSAGIGKFTISGAQNHKLVLAAQDSAAITVAKTVDKVTANSGDILTYTLTYKNNGDKNATNVKLEDAIPNGATYVNGSADNGGTLTNSKVVWSLNTLAPNATGTRSFKVTVN